MDRNVAGGVVPLEAVQDHQAGLVGQAHVQDHGAGLELPGQSQGLLGRAGDKDWKPISRDEVAHDGGELVIVLHDQQHAPGPDGLIAVVVDLRGAGARAGARAARRLFETVGSACGATSRGATADGVVGERNGDGEGAALARAGSPA